VHALKEMLVPRTKVIRNSLEKEINSLELVPGDIVLLASGSNVPADLGILGGRWALNAGGKSYPLNSAAHNALKRENSRQS